MTTVLLSGCNGGKENYNEVDYLAVQFEDDENWSIIDAKGEVIAEQEYPADNRITPIYKGAYWVGSDEGYNLYNISDPKKPLTETAYDRVTCFAQGRAVASKLGEPIHIIATDGSIVKEMDGNVTRVYTFSNDGLAIYMDAKSGKYGYIDRDGEVAIQAKYIGCTAFADGVALAFSDSAKAENNIISIINKEGIETGKIDLNKYELLSIFFKEGLIPACQKESSSKHIEFLNTSGKNELTVRKSEYDSSGSSEDIARLVGLYNFFDGYAVFKNKDNNYGVVNKEGEVVIRPKYDALVNIGGGKFRAKRNDKWGIVDKEDNTVIPFDYDEVYAQKLGSNYLVKDGTQICTVGADGKKAFNDEYNKYAWDAACEYAEFVDINGIANEIADGVTPDAYKGLSVGATVKDLASALGKASPIELLSDGIVQTTSQLKSDASITKSSYYEFYDIRSNDAAFKIKRVVVNIEANNKLPMDNILEKISDKLKSVGFKNDDNVIGVSYLLKAKSTICTSEDDHKNTTAVAIIKNSDRRFTFIYEYPTAVEEGKYKATTIKAKLDESPITATTSSVADTIAVEEPANTGQSSNNYASGSSNDNPYNWLSTRLATSNDIAGMSKAEIRVLRNAIFARHGYKFKDKSLLQHFSQFSWYSPRYSDITSMLNDIEQKNIKFLKSHE